MIAKTMKCKLITGFKHELNTGFIHVSQTTGLKDMIHDQHRTPTLSLPTLSSIELISCLIFASFEWYVRT